jgi:hypothetical protein
MRNSRSRISSFTPRDRARRSVQRREALLDLGEPLLQRINPADQLSFSRRDVVLQRPNIHICGDSQYRHTNYAEGGNQYERRSA